MTCSCGERNGVQNEVDQYKDSLYGLRQFFIHVLSITQYVVVLSMTLFGQTSGPHKKNMRRVKKIPSIIPETGNILQEQAPSDVRAKYGL